MNGIVLVFYYCIGKKTAHSGVVKKSRTEHFCSIRLGTGFFEELPQLDNIISFEQQYVRISEPGEVATALRNLGQRTDVFQMLFIVRGGSEAIASTFEHPSVLDALAECTLPVVSALGHESSHTEFDHYADKSFTTPTDLGAWIGERLRSQKALYAGYVAKLRKMQSLEREKIRERQKFCVHGIIGARQTGASNEHEHQTQFS